MSVLRTAKRATCCTPAQSCLDSLRATMADFYRKSAGWKIGITASLVGQTIKTESSALHVLPYSEIREVRAMFAGIKHHLRYWGFLLLKFGGAVFGSGLALWFLNLFWAPHTRALSSGHGRVQFRPSVYMPGGRLVSIFLRTLLPCDLGSALPLPHLSPPSVHAD